LLETVVVPLTRAVGEAWLRGQLQVYEEHACTEALQSALRQAVAQLPPAAPDVRPRVLLSTLPGEPHGLGLLMVEAQLACEGVACVSLVVQTPVGDLALAAAAYRCDVVALVFTGCTNPKQTVEALQELRGRLPAGTQVWVGGSAPVLQRRRVQGVQPLDDLCTLPEAVSTWRTRHAGST
jgi:methanogenic corrinoid protein MtbC1